MKKLILKFSIFILPIIIITIIPLFIKDNPGDLLRMGYIFSTNSYRPMIEEKFEVLPIKYKELSSWNNTQNNYTVLVIGDSFSEQKEFGYKNYLSNKEKISVLHVDRFLFQNPLQYLLTLTNGDLFDKIKIDFVILQSVERHFSKRALDLKRNSEISLDSIIRTIKKPIITRFNEFQLFNDKVIKIPLINLMYPFNDKPLDSKTYRVATKTNLFSTENKELLFYQEDLDNLHYSNKKNIEILNNELNRISLKLKEKGTKLIVLPSPDKYDFYYNMIDSKTYPKPLFFEHLKPLNKDYIYIDSKAILTKLVPTHKDIYYYDDTHWSPISAKEIADNLYYIIMK